MNMVMLALMLLILPSSLRPIDDDGAAVVAGGAGDVDDGGVLGDAGVCNTIGCDNRVICIAITHCAP